MSHFSLLVITETKPDEVGLQVLLEPYVEEEEGGKWDWYTVGGRWTGHLDDYDPAKDSRNIEQCSLCRGTGKRNDALGKEQRRIEPGYTCNGCQGKGWHVKWPTQWVEHNGDSLQIKTLNGGANLVRPTHAVLKDGKWFESGDMGWWGIVHDEKPAEEWEAEFAKLIASLPPETWLTIVDCHV